MPSSGFTRDNVHLYRSCFRVLAVVGGCVWTSVWLTVREKGSGTWRKFRPRRQSWHVRRCRLWEETAWEFEDRVLSGGVTVSRCVLPQTPGDGLSACGSVILTTFPVCCGKRDRNSELDALCVHLWKGFNRIGTYLISTGTYPWISLNLELRQMPVSLVGLASCWTKVSRSTYSWTVGDLTCKGGSGKSSHSHTGPCVRRGACMRSQSRIGGEFRYSRRDQKLWSRMPPRPCWWHRVVVWP